MRDIGTPSTLSMVRESHRLDEALAYMRGWATRQSTSDVLEEVLQGKHLKQT